RRAEWYAWRDAMSCVAGLVLFGIAGKDDDAAAELFGEDDAFHNHVSELSDGRVFNRGHIFLHVGGKIGGHVFGLGSKRRASGPQPPCGWRSLSQKRLSSRCLPSTKLVSAGEARQRARSALTSGSTFGYNSQ